jgi:hypothetical protein
VLVADLLLHEQRVPAGLPCRPGASRAHAWARAHASVSYSHPAEYDSLTGAGARYAKGYRLDRCAARSVPLRGRDLRVAVGPGAGRRQHSAARRCAAHERAAAFARPDRGGQRSARWFCCGVRSHWATPAPSAALRLGSAGCRRSVSWPGPASLSLAQSRLGKTRALKICRARRRPGTGRGGQRDRGPLTDEASEGRRPGSATAGGIAAHVRDRQVGAFDDVAGSDVAGDRDDRDGLPDDLRQVRSAERRQPPARRPPPAHLGTGGSGPQVAPVERPDGRWVWRPAAGRRAL